MLQLNLVSRVSRVGVFALGLVLCASSLSSAQDDAGTRHGRKGHKRARAEMSSGNACVDAYKAAQEQEKAARLREARESLLECAKSTCGKLLREQCRIRYTQLEDDIPSVVPLVTDESGAPSVDVQVKLDGKPFSSRIEGSSLPVDPGVHEFSFEKDGDVFATQKVMIVQGQRNRPISVSLRSSSVGKSAGKLTLAASNPAPRKEAAAQAPMIAAADPSSSKAEKEQDEAEVAEPASSVAPRAHHSWATYALAGVGVAGLAGFGLGTYWGRKDNDALKACSPTCNPEPVDHVHKMYLAADISLGVGVAALGAATYLWFHESSTAKEEAAAEKSAYRFELSPLRSGGAVAGLAGSF